MGCPLLIYEEIKQIADAIKGKKEKVQYVSLGNKVPDRPWETRGAPI